MAQSRKRPHAAVAEDVELERSLLKSGLGGAACGVDSGGVPVIDMSQGDDACAAAMWEAATGVGFFTVTNHGIDEALIDRAFGAAASFFAQPVADKETQSPFAREMNSGFEYMAQVRPSTGLADRKESLQITARAGAMEGRWPASPGDFEGTAKELMAKAHALGCRVLSLLEPRACPTLSRGTLAKSHQLWAPDGQCTLRLLHYMPTDKAALAALQASGRQHWRAGPHTDWCCCTLLFQRPGNEGLECASNPRAGSTRWTAVDPVPGGIAVNVGDMLARWSDNRLLSNLHRVRLPTPAECDPPKPRYSMAFFLQADKHCMLESETYEPITAGDYLLGRIRSNFADSAAAVANQADGAAAGAAEGAAPAEGAA
uniref:Fe2OG dioxygenase domain-containing protein n=1 Tax=Zooxanthella nutricula TaxID=1333877 RepID=A0A7S2JWP6_9DINO